jgi:hypothetical protein
MNWPKHAVLAACMVGGFAVVARADQWNDRTTLKFDAPVMIPGATLAPGTYTFKLLDSAALRHVVQIYNEDLTRLIATVNAVPAKRQEANDDTVVKFQPTDGAAAPVALKAWFYPGSLFGHEFVYSDTQARDIARRTKTLVLAGDAAGDMTKGTLYTYDADATKTPWRPDATMMQDWQRWNDEGRRAATAQVAAPGRANTRESTAPVVRGTPAGMKVAVGDLEDHPSKYAGKVINVTAEVEEVFGPRLFKIDEPDWADLDGEVLVYLPSDLAALVREDDRVTVSGTVKRMVRADLERELGWLQPDPDFEVEFASRPVIVAREIVGGNNNVGLAIRMTPSPDTSTAVGTSGSSGSSAAGSSANEPITSQSMLGNGTEHVGRHVNLQGLSVIRSSTRGFWVNGGDRNLFVLPATGAAGAEAPGRTFSPGQSVSIQGIVLEMPGRLRGQARGMEKANDEVYIYATSVK